MPYRSIPDDEVSPEVLAFRKSLRRMEAVLERIPGKNSYSWGDAGVRYVKAVLPCGHSEEAHSEMGGYDEPPYAVPSFETLAHHLKRRVILHDCDIEEARRARLMSKGFPF